MFGNEFVNKTFKTSKKGGTMTQNQLTYWQNQENKRHNLATEKELSRTNRANENIKAETNSITSLRNQRDYELGIANLGETTRSHKTDEAERQRNNIVNNYLQGWLNAIKEKEAESGRMTAQANLSQAASAAMNAQTNRLNYAELNRSNLAQEVLKREAQAEQARTNLENENIKRFQNVTNRETGKQNANTQRMSQQETQRHQIVTENETKRNNLINQALKTAELQNDINIDTANVKNNSLRNLTSPLRLSIPLANWR